MWWEKNKDLVMWVAGLLLASGGVGTYAIKGVTSDAREQVRIEMQTKVDEKDKYIKALENEVDDLQLDAVSIGFKYDLCCSTGGSCQ